MEKSDYLQQGLHKKFHFELSEIVRAYFEATYSLLFTDMTLEEIRRSLSSLSSIDDAIKKDFLTILEKGDLVKFTDMLLSDGEDIELLQRVRGLVEKTKPTEIFEEEESVL